MKKKRRSAKASKKRAVPDELFQKGPLSFARFGNFTVGQGNWQPGQFEEFQRRLVRQYPKIVSEIDGLIKEACGLIAVTEPLYLLHRAWWVRASAYVKIRSEIEVKKEHADLERMVDYVQSLIAATPPAASQEPITDEGWEKLSGLVAAIFEKLNPWYFISEQAQRRASDPAIDEAVEEFRFKAQAIWCNVTGAQYQNHNIQALRELLIPQGDIIHKAYGLSGEELCDELAKIWHSLTMGIGDAFDAMKEFRDESLAALESDIAAGLGEGGTPQEEMTASIIRHKLEDKRDRAVGLFLGIDLFDLQKVTNLPQHFLDDFSWSPGQETSFLAEGERKGWPLRIWPTFMRPFLKLGGRYYCFDQHVLFDHFFRQLEKKIYQVGESAKQSWIANRKQATEQLPFDYLARILPQASQLKEIYYTLAEDGNKAKKFETDGILIYDDHLFVVEVKSGAFTYTDPTSDFPAYAKSIETLLADPAKQGNRFLRYLRSSDEVPLFDSAGNEVMRIRQANYREVTVCAISLDPFTEIAAQTQHVHEIGIEVGDEPVWAVSLDDLRVYADIFSSPLEFLHFIEQRKLAFASNQLELNDELDHLGLYLKHNHYSRYLHEATGNSPMSSIQALGYRQRIDEFFSAKLRDPGTETPLKQEMPPLMAAVLDRMALSHAAGRSEFASYLLDLDGNARKDIFVQAQQEIERSADYEPRPLSIYGETRLTVMTWSARWGNPTKDGLLDHAKAMLLLHEEADRHVLQLEFDEGGRLLNLDWKILRPSEIPFLDRPRLLKQAELLREKRLSRAIMNMRHVGRNEQCPCGSGKKFKKCCIGRSA